MFSMPNSVTSTDDLYISYNYVDHEIYGSDTTALVTGQMEKFYILNGDHKKEYEALIPQGLDACLTYFRENIEEINKLSDKIE